MASVNATTNATGGVRTLLGNLWNEVPSMNKVKEVASGYFASFVKWIGETGASLKASVSNLPKEGIIGGIVAIVALVVTTVLCCKCCNKEAVGKGSNSNATVAVDDVGPGGRDTSNAVRVPVNGISPADANSVNVSSKN